MSDRRLWFFLAAAAICAALVPVAPAELRWVPVGLSLAYVGLSVLVVLDVLGRGSRAERHARSRRGHPGSDGEDGA